MSVGYFLIVAGQLNITYASETLDFLFQVTDLISKPFTYRVLLCRYLIENLLHKDIGYKVESGAALRFIASSTVRILD